MKRKRENSLDFNEEIKRVKNCTNYRCPISLESITELREGNVLLFLWIKGKRYLYNMRELYKYIFCGIYKYTVFFCFLSVNTLLRTICGAM